MKKRHAFTLVELLVVIAIIALLMSILVPALRLARDQAYRAVCSNNIRDIVLGFMLYGDDYDNRLPSGGAEGNWPWDMTRNTSRRLLKYMGVDTSLYSAAPAAGGVAAAGSGGYGGGSGGDIPVQPVFFCPANIQQKRTRECNWGYPGTQYRVLGYAFLWATSWNGNGNNDIFGPDRKPDISKQWVKSMAVKQPANTELVVDATLSNNDDSTFTRITCGGIDQCSSVDSTNHAYSETKPVGGNIGFVDGHMEWRPFKEMYVRWPTQINACPHFWW